MNIIFVGKKHGRSRTFKLESKGLLLASVSILVLSIGFVGLGVLGAKHYYQIGDDSFVDGTVIEHWKQQLDSQEKRIKDVERQSNQKLDALTLNMGDMQARLFRLDALGQRLTEVAKLKNGEFDFNSAPSLGGPIVDQNAESFTVTEFENELKNLAQTIADREQQLSIIERLMDQKRIADDAFIAGRPIKWGWMSSAYGYRSDPFTGKRAWHAGVDFAGKEGSDIIAVAAGVVTWSGKRYGYGNLVEINHGNGYSTRYAHCKELLVEVGSIVEKGEVIALMGSTGRSTGPHVHYEVIKNGRTENPKKFIYRASRG